MGLNHPDSAPHGVHSPAALVVEEEDEVEILFGFVLHLFSDAQHVHGRHRDGHAVVLAAHARHVRVDDLHTARGGDVTRRFVPMNAEAWPHTHDSLAHLSFNSEVKSY